MPDRQVSEKQQSANRANAQRSRGPITPEGKARSAANSLRHGLFSHEVVLPHEDRAQFEAHRQSYMDSFQPADQPAADLVETMASARWRLNRVVGMENKIFEAEMLRHSKQAEGEFFEIRPQEKLAWCFDHMANNSKSLQLLIRYEGSLNRTYERALKQFLLLQPARPAESPAAPPATDTESHCEAGDPVASQPGQNPQPEATKPLPANDETNPIPPVEPVPALPAEDQEA